MPGTMRYLHEMSKEEASYWRGDNSKRQISSKYTFPSLPWPIRDDWNRLEALHPFVLGLAYADGPSQVKDTWRKSMRQIRSLSGVDSMTPVHDKIRILHEADSISLPPRTTLWSIIIPSSRLLAKLDQQRAKSLEDLRELIRPGRHLFEDMLSNPIQFEYDHSEMPIEEVVDLYESYYLLEPIEEKWGRWGSWKCMCESFMSAAVCGHSLLLAMLYDKTLEFPPKHSSKKLELRSRSTRRPSAWAPEQEDEEEAEPKLDWRPVSACDDMELRPLPKKSQTASQPETSSDEDAEDESHKANEAVDSHAPGEAMLGGSAETITPSDKPAKSVQPSPKAKPRTRPLSQPTQRRTPKPLDFVSTSASQPEVYMLVFGVLISAKPD